MNISAGDVVRHGPTGEEWYVLGVNERRGELCPAGWPHTIARITDCTLQKKGAGISDAERRSRAQMFPGFRWDDELPAPGD